MPTAEGFIAAVEAANPSKNVPPAHFIFTHPKAPLAFVARWNLGNIARITDEAVEKIGKALRA